MPDQRLVAGSPAFRHVNLAMFFGGFASFAMLYGTQPLLPLLSTEYSLDPAAASLAVSAGTAGLALTLIPASVLSDRFGRERLMKLSLVASALVCTASAFVADFPQLLVLRALLGVAIAGLPAAAIAYLAEEIAPAAQGRAMGLYIGGNALGGMSGRFLAAVVTDWGSWRLALGLLGALGVISAVLFWRRLPASRHFRPRDAALGRILSDARTMLADPGLPWLFLIGFLLMGTFVALYNYLAYRLSATPYLLGQSAIGAIFLLYLLGSAASALAGRLADRHGRRNVLWIMLGLMATGLVVTLAAPLATIVAGVALSTFGFFAAHALASGWVSRRAPERPALAAALYLFGYYLGASVIGTVAGKAWSAGGWPGLVAMLASCTLLMIGAALRARRAAILHPAPAD
ncbi:MAG: MFS transporter [Burkholderiaceae bacterium]|jgi:YNFM family putative membrane transporter|nr:MFS transporter [Burkholderiaceae bacterium]MEB2352051.1 MFS transporter [Burkholderiaceae bacterium]